MNFFSHRYALWRGGKNAVAADTDLSSHDLRFHPNGFDPERETCNKRAELAKADKGDVLSPSEGAEKGGDKPLVSAAEDAAYMDAAKKGDIKRARQLVRQVAKRILEGSIVQSGVWHSTKKKFTVFQNRTPNVFFFARDKKWAEAFGKKERYAKPEDTKEYYVNIRNPLDMMDEKTGTEWLNYFHDKGIEIGEAGVEKLRRMGNNQLPGWAILNHDMSEPYGTGFRDAILKAGYDGVVFEDVAFGKNDRTTYGAFQANQIKSADPVTYDDDGNVIPLSRRFDGGDDIRGDVSGKGEAKK